LSNVDAIGNFLDLEAETCGRGESGSANQGVRGIDLRAVNRQRGTSLGDQGAEPLQ
jgi:hypothetical protein